MQRLRLWILSLFDAASRELAEDNSALRREISRLAAAVADRDADVDRLSAVAAQRALAAESQAEQLVVQLADARHELDKTTKALAVAEEENRRLWAVCQRDHARVAKERALLDRTRMEAEASAVQPDDEE